MVIKTQVEFPDYVRMVYTSTYKNPLVIIMTLLGIVCVVMMPLYLAGVFSYDRSPFAALLFGLYTIVAMPLLIYYRAKKTFTTNLRLQEAIIYEITPEKIIITGATFNSELLWTSTYKILELKDFFLIYGSKQVANLIPKKGMTATEVSELRNILREVHAVKKKKFMA